MKTVFITSYHSLISRNILQTDILPILKNNGIKIVILAPFEKAHYFEDYFASENVFIEGRTPKQDFFDNWIDFISISLVSAENLFVRNFWSNKKYAKFYLAHLIYFLFGKIFILKTFLCVFCDLFSRSSTFDDLFKKYKPDLVFATDIYHAYDRELVKEAKKAGIYTVGMVRSWDNVTTKGVMLAIPDKIIVPNEILQSELWEYNRIPSGRIFVSGIPHYDQCIEQRAISREQFFQKMGLDAAKKLILVAPAGALLYKYDGEVLKLFQKLLNENVFSKKVQFLVRFPPADTICLNGFRKDANFVFDVPGLNANDVKKEAELTKKDAEHLNDTLYYSDLVVTIVSTMAIDAAVFDKPCIIFSFNTQGSSEDKIEKFMTYAHFKKFIFFTSCRVAKSAEEFISAANRYLENPSLDREKRKQIQDAYCYKIDGCSSKRVAQCILEYLV